MIKVISIKRLFILQKEFEYKVKVEKRLENRLYIKDKIMGLLAELGELSNEWNGFKYWKANNKPRTIALSGNDNCVNSGYGMHFSNPLLEEYVDVLHMFLAVGLEFGFEREIGEIKLKHEHIKDIKGCFIKLFSGISSLAFPESIKKDGWLENFSLFLRLGDLLGFQWEEVQIAFIQKQEINLHRLDYGY